MSVECTVSNHFRNLIEAIKPVKKFDELQSALVRYLREAIPDPSDVTRVNDVAQAFVMLGGMPNIQAFISGMGSDLFTKWLAVNEASTWILERIRPGEEIAQDESSKIDSLDTNTENEDISRWDAGYLMKVYGGNSAAKIDVLVRFANLSTGMFFVRLDGAGEVTEQEDLEANIVASLNKIYQELRTAAIDLKLPQAEKLPTVLVYEGTNKEEKTKKAWAQFKGISQNWGEVLEKKPAELNDLAVSARNGNVNNQNLLSVFQNNFILNNFDKLVQSRFKDSLEVKLGHNQFTGVTYQGKSKYIKHDSNKSMRSTWVKDDGNQTDALAETSQHVKAFFDGMMKYSYNGSSLPRTTSAQEVSDAWLTVVDSIRYGRNIFLNFNRIQEIYEYFSPREIHLLEQQSLQGPKNLKNCDLQVLIHNAKNDPELTRLLFKALAYPKGKPLFNIPGYTDAARNIMYSLYKNIFADDAPMYQALTKAHGIYDAANPPKYYCEWFYDFFNNLSRVDMGELVMRKQIPTPITLVEKGNNNGSFSYRSKRNATFSATVDFEDGHELTFIRRGRMFSLNPQDLQEGTEGYIDIKLRGHNANEKNPNYLIRRYSDGRIEIYGEPDTKIDLDTFSSSNPLFPKVQQFYFEVLNLNHYPKNNVSNALVNAGFQAIDAIKLATDILYNYAVSYKVAEAASKNPNGLSDDEYRTEAGKYFTGPLKESFKLQRDGSDLETVSDKLAPDVIKLVKAIDELEGRVRNVVCKSADGTNINVVSTTQLAYSAPDQWMEAIKNPNYACGGFSLRGAYRGLEFARDTVWGGENKRVSDYSEAEMFAGNFMGGFLSPLYAPDDAKVARILRLIPLVVSDKVRMPNIKIDLEAESPVIDPKTKTHKKWKDCTTEEIQGVTKKELGKYYENVFKEFGRRFKFLDVALAVTDPDARVVKSFGSDQANADVSFFLKELKKIGAIGYEDGFTRLNEISAAFRATELAKIAEAYSVPVNFDRTTENFKLIRGFMLEETHAFGKSLAEVQEDLKAGQLEYLTAVSQGNQAALDEAEAIWRADKNRSGDTPLHLYFKFREACEQDVYKRTKKAVSNVFHELTAKSKQLGSVVMLPANSTYIVMDNGDIHVNPVLVDQLYRYDKMSATKAQSLLPKGLDLSTGEGKAETFFANKTQQTLKNILQDGGSLIIQGDALKTAAKQKFFPEEKDSPTSAFGNRYVLGIVTYPGRDSDGNIKTFTESITDRTSFESSHILKEAFNWLRYSSGKEFKYDSASEWFESTDFNFADFEAAAAAAIMQREQFIKSSRAFDRHWKERLDGTQAFYKGLMEQETAKFDLQIKEQEDAARHFEALGRSRDYNIALARIENLQEKKKKKLSDLSTKLQTEIQSIKEIKEELKQNYAKIKETKNFITKEQAVVKVVANPDIARYNAFSFLFGQEYTISTVGSHINHPGMKNAKLGLKAVEALCFQQQTKRNVSLTATKNRFNLGRLNGLGAKVKSSIISNTKDAVYNLTGTRDEVFNDDGACYTVGVGHYWENNSLGPNAVGIDKKTFFHMHDQELGLGYIGKDAGFTANNDRIRASLFYAYINYRGLSDPDGELTEIVRRQGGLDITTSYDGNRINIPNFAYEKVTIKDRSGKPIEELNPVISDWDSIPEHSTIAVDGSSVTFDKETGLTNFTATIYTDGKPVTKQLSMRLKNVHDIWMFFGGAYSGTMSSNGTIPFEKFNDKSTELTANICNLVGTLTEGVNPEDQIVSQSQVNQYLKNSVVVYMPTVESVKQGAANVNDVSLIGDKDYKFVSMTLDLNDAGVQLNAEHHADDTVISMMTQVLNALGARGYTATEGDRTYQALRALTETNLGGYVKALKDANGNAITPEGIEQINRFVASIISKAIRSSDLEDGTLVGALTFQARNALENKAGNLNYDEIMKYIPINDLGLLRAHMSKISSSLVKSCIKVKFPGSMDVLSPSNGRFLLYDGKMLDQYKGDFKSLVDKDKEAQENAHRNTHVIRLGTTYRLSTKSKDLKLDTFLLGTANADGTVDVKVNTPAEYWAIQDFMMRNPEALISEVFSVGRDLAAYNITFKSETGEFYNVWDIETIKNLYNESLSGDPEQKAEALTKLQKELAALSSDPNFTEVEVRTFDLATGEWVTKFVKVQPESVEVAPYEVIMSMHDQEQFGLRVGDDVSTISKNKLFFLDRYLQERYDNDGILDRFFDFEIRPMKEDNKLWISLTDKPVDTGYFTLVEDTAYEDTTNPDNITYWQLNYTSDKIRQLSSKSDKIYRGAKGETLIVTENPEFYLENTAHASVTISERIAQRDADRLIDIFNNHLLNCESRSIQGFIKRFKERLNPTATDEGDVDDNAIDISNFAEELEEKKDIIAKELKSFITAGRDSYNKSIDYVKTVLAGKGSPEDKLAKLLGKDAKNRYLVRDARVRNLIENTLEVHTSFLKSLEVLAARIPAQCMQSFMAMRIAGFDRSGVNTAYVSRFQIYLQGSDFDIDKVSLLGFKFRQGKFVTWSPFMDISSIENLEASLNIPFPTGLTSDILEDSAKRCSLGDNVLQGLQSSVTRVGDQLVYVMKDSKGNELFNLVPHREIDPEYNNIPIPSKVWEDFTALSDPNLTEEESAAALQEIIKKYNDYIPEELLEDINSGEKVNIRKLRTSILDRIAALVDMYLKNAPITSYDLQLGQNLDTTTQKAISRSLSYITEVGQKINIPSGGEFLQEYGFTVENNVATRTDDNISAASDFLSFILAHLGDNQLFTRKDGKFILNTGERYKGNKVQLLKDLSTFIQAVNDFGGIPQFTDPAAGNESVYNASIQDILNIINRHNLNLAKNSHKLSDALINFISTSMYSVSKNPINQIQAQSSVDASDGTVQLTKDMAKKSEYSKKLLEFNPGSITSIYRMTKLTLGGKTNVGITASSLKTFEGLTQYTYNVLNHGTAERASALLAKRTFMGKETRLIANAYQQNKQNFLPLDVYVALEESAKRSGFDAYLWYSGILSLSTDNAKDPTTVKINAGEKMLPLYLAGLAVGCEMKDLIAVMTSRAGILINSLMESNIFTGSKGCWDVKSVIKYIEQPEKIVRNMDLVTLSKLYDQYKYIAYHGVPENSIPAFEASLMFEREAIDYVLHNGVRELTRLLRGDSLDDEAKRKVRRDLRNLEDFKNKVNTIKNCTIEIDGEVIYPYSEIKKLNHVLQEMKMFSQIGKLNQGLPNTIQEQLVWKENFEKAIGDRLDAMEDYEKNSVAFKKAIELLEEANTEIGMETDRTRRVDFMQFVENPEYRDKIIRVYDGLKYMINPYAAMAELAHYFGYMKTAAAMFRVNESSSIYKTVEYIARHITPLKGSQEQREAKLSRIIDWVSDNMTADFLRRTIPPIELNLPENSFKVYQRGSGLTMTREVVNSENGIIVLGSQEGNATFKVLMEDFVIPRLKAVNPNNPLLSSLTAIKYDKTSDKNFIVKLATETSGAPIADFELEGLAKYKSGLKRLSSVTLPELGGMSAVDALFLYNLIVNGGKVGQTTLSMVFEDYAISQGKTSEEFAGYGSDIIAAYYDSRRADDTSILQDIMNMSEEDIEGLKMALALEDNDFTSKEDYIIAKNPKTRKYELLHRVASKKTNGTDEDGNLDTGEGDSNEDDGDVDRDAAGLNDDEDEGTVRGSFLVKRYYEKLKKFEYVPVGPLNSGKLARALLVSSKSKLSAQAQQSLYQNPITGEIRLRYGKKLLKFSDLVDMMTPEARKALKEGTQHEIKSIKGLLKEFGFIKSAKAGVDVELTGMNVETLIDFLTKPQC